MGDIGCIGGYLGDATRIPTGLFPLDVALGGGFPRGRVSMIYGPESSCKTNIALRAIAMHQMLWPHLTCVFVDVENHFDPAWAKKMGVNTDELIVLRPGFAEKAVDLIEAFLMTDDCGLVVVDSIAALMSTSEGEASAERANVGGTSTPITKLYRKTTHIFGEAEKLGRFPTLIYINQITFKIGVVYGNPETFPGGQKPKYQSSMILRVYGTNVEDAKINQFLPIAKDVKFIVKKHKYPVLQTTGDFRMITVPYAGFHVGECDDYSTIKAYLEQLGLLEKADKKGWTIMGEHYDIQETFKSRYRTDPKFAQVVRQKIAKESLIASKMIEKGDMSDKPDENPAAAA